MEQSKINLSKNRVRPVCVFILSEKSSGSSFLWRVIKDTFSIPKYPSTSHFENETLFWTKAASVLSLPQVDMEKSEIPYTKARAEKEIVTFLNKNLQNGFNDILDKKTIFESWKSLVIEYGPVFIEKSPHHLLQNSVIDLILEFKKEYEGIIDVKIIGLIRNPVHTIGSEIRRWGMDKDKAETQWVDTYNNLLRLTENLDGKELFVIRFEDFKNNPSEIRKEIVIFIDENFNSTSMQIENTRKTKSEKNQFAFNLQNETIKLGHKFGYTDNELIFEYSWSDKLKYATWRYLRPFLKSLLRKK